MTWNLKPKPHRQYERNALHAVVAQLRFHPVLKVNETVAAFQDTVRKQFPSYEKTKARDIHIDAATNAVTVSEHVQHHFKRLDGAAMIALQPTAVTVEARRHENHDIFLGFFKSASDALNDAYGDLAPTRLGLRYINVFNKAEIGKHLGRSVDWNDLIDGRFLKLPGDLADLTGTNFQSQTNSPIGDGRMTLRFGIEGAGDGAVFRLDFDRYQEGDFAATACLPLLRQFHEDIHSVFLAFAGDALTEWMEPKT